MDKKYLTYKKIQDLNAFILRSPSLPMAIKIHCKLITDAFNKEKLFYKYIFKNNRFIISTITSSVFYNRKEDFLSDVVYDRLKKRRKRRKRRKRED